MPTKRKEPPAATGNPLINNETLRKLYTVMLKARMLAQAVAALPAGAPPQTGTEAALAGVISHLRAEDSLSPAPGDFVAAFLKGQSLEQIVSQVRARTDQSQNGFHGAGLAANIVPASAARSQLSVANGIAIANKVRNHRAVSVAFFGDEARPKRTDGDAWTEALAFAVAHKLPSIFVVLNRLQSTSRRGLATDYSARGEELGLPVIPVDGNDVVAVYRVAQESIIRARQGSSPTLIEARMSVIKPEAARTTAKSNGHLAGHTDPLAFMESYLTSKGLFTPAWKDPIVTTFREQLGTAFKATVRESRKPVART